MRRKAAAIRPISIGVPAAREVVNGATGDVNRYGLMRSRGDESEIEAVSRSASELLCSSSEHPVSIGFMTATRSPRCLRQCASAAVMSVFPTPVSVPVTKHPVMLTKRGLMRLFANSRAGVACKQCGANSNDTAIKVPDLPGNILGYSEPIDGANDVIDVRCSPQGMIRYLFIGQPPT